MGSVLVVGNVGFFDAIAQAGQARGPSGHSRLMEHAAGGAEYRNILAGSHDANSPLKKAAQRTEAGSRDNQLAVCRTLRRGPTTAQWVFSR